MVRSSRVAGIGAPADVPGGSALARLVRRLRRGDGVSGNGALEVPIANATPQTPSPGNALVPIGRAGRSARVLAAVVIGLDATALERTLDAVRAGSERAGDAPGTLFLTDGADFEPFRSRSLLFEYLPPLPLRERFAPDLDWDLYILRRLARLRRKWNPVRIVAFGPSAQMLIALWRASPFEDQGIKDLIRAPQPDGEAPSLTTD